VMEGERLFSGELGFGHVTGLIGVSVSRLHSGGSARAQLHRAFGFQTGPSICKVRDE
jgi:hypothetical protein